MSGLDLRGETAKVTRSEGAQVMNSPGSEVYLKELRDRLTQFEASIAHFEAIRKRLIEQRDAATGARRAYLETSLEVNERSLAALESGRRMTESVIEIHAREAAQRH